MEYGYVRVSSDDQTVEPQIAQLLSAGVSREAIVADDATSGTTKAASRTGLAALLTRLQPGDVLTVVRLDRLGRTTLDLLQTVAHLKDRGVVVRGLSDGVDSSTSAGQLVLEVMASLASYERRLMLERQREGIKSAKARGKHLGRPPRLSPGQRAHARQLKAEGRTVGEVAALLGCAPNTARRAMADLA